MDVAFGSAKVPAEHRVTIKAGVPNRDDTAWRARLGLAKGQSLSIVQQRELCIVDALELAQ